MHCVPVIDELQVCLQMCIAAWHFCGMFVSMLAAVSVAQHSVSQQHHAEPQQELVLLQINIQATAKASQQVQAAAEAAQLQAQKL